MPHGAMHEAAGAVKAEWLHSQGPGTLSRLPPPAISCSDRVQVFTAWKKLLVSLNIPEGAFSTCSVRFWVLSHSVASHSLLPLTVALQAPLSMGFSRQEYWSRLPRPPPGDLPNPGVEPRFPVFPALAGRFFSASATCSFYFILFFTSILYWGIAN